MKRGSMKRKKSGPQALVAYLCRFRPEPEAGFTITCLKLPSVLPIAKPWKKAQPNARVAIGLWREAGGRDGQHIPPPDPDLASPLDPLVPRTDAYARGRCRRSPTA